MAARKPSRRLRGGEAPAAAAPLQRPLPPSAPPPGRFDLLCAAAVLVITAGLFWPVLGNGFVEWDDPSTILNNVHLRELNATNLRWMFSTFFWGHYQPLLWLSYAVDYAWAEALWGDGLTPAAYHAASLLLHALAAVLLFLLSRRLLAAALQRRTPAATPPADHAAPPGRAGSLTLSAAVAALLFALHPLRVEPVAWVTGRGDLLAAVFLLAATLAWWRATETASRAAYLAGLALAAALYALSLLSRAAGVMLPVVLLLLDWFPRRRWGGGKGRWLGREARGVWLEKLPFAALAAAAAIVAPYAKAAAGSTVELARHGLIERYAQACHAFLFYLWKTLLPVGLSPIYELRLPLDATEPKYLAAMLIAPLGLLALAWSARKRPAPAAAIAAFLILLLPVLGVVQSGNQYAADRYTYLPAMALAVLAAGGLPAAWQAGRPRAAGAAAAALLLTTAGGWLTARQVGVWRSNESLWTHAASVTPNSSIARNGYGWTLLQAGRYEEAAAHFRAAIRLQPANQQAHHNWWTTLARQGRSDDLLRAYQESVRVFPNFADAHFRLAEELARRGRNAEAATAYRATLALRPRDSQALNNFGLLLARQGDTEGARRCYREAIAADGGNLIARRNYARLLHAENRVAEALAELEAALRVAPTDEATQRLLAEWRAAAPPG